MKLILIFVILIVNINANIINNFKYNKEKNTYEYIKKENIKYEITFNETKKNKNIFLFFNTYDKYISKKIRLSKTKYLVFFKYVMFDINSIPINKYKIKNIKLLNTKD